MARVRKLLLTLASGSALYSGLVPALGLGGITLHSALNQPFEADIQLLEVGDLESSDVHVRLASEADFARVGVDRLFFLNDLRFTPLLKGAGSVIHVASSQPVREPYLSFVVSVARPGGQLLREYTVLLDPPGSSAYRAVTTAQASPRAEVSPERPVTAPRPLLPATQGQHYLVQRGDSLWLIAQRLRKAGSQASMQTLMDGIHGLNPQAFVGNDRNRLQVNSNLLLPDVAVVPTAAPAAPVATTAPSAAPAAPTAEPSASAAAPVDVVQTAATQQRVDAELAARAEENRQLQASMLAVQAQLANLQQEIEAKNQQLALLNADLAERNTPAQSAPTDAPVATAPAPVVSTPEQPAAVVAPVEPARGLPGWLTGVAGLLLGVFAGFAVWARKRTPPEAPTPVVAPVMPRAPVQAKVELPVQPAVVLPPRPAVVAPQPVIVNRAASVDSDPLEGANIYIAYGRFGEALTVLRKAVEREPERTDLRLRLLEVQGELADGAGYAETEAVLRQQGVPQAELDPLWARYATRLVSAPKSNPTDVVLQLDEPELVETPRVEVTPEPLDDFQLNLDDLSLDADWDQVSPFKTAASTRTKPAAAAKVANDPAFRSDLHQLPEISEMQFDHDALNPFSNWASSAEPVDEVFDAALDEEFIDAFSREPVKSSHRPKAHSIEHLASNRENLVKLNKALAYIEQGDLGSACSILNEVISDGDDQQKQEARDLLARIA